MNEYNKGTTHVAFNAFGAATEDCMGCHQAQRSSLSPVYHSFCFTAADSADTMKEISTKHITIFLAINIFNEAFDIKCIMVAASQVTPYAKEKIKM